MRAGSRDVALMNVCANVQIALPIRERFIVSESSQKHYQVRFILVGQLETELVSRDRPTLESVSYKSSGHVICVKPARIKPILEGSDAAVMLQRPPVPDAFQRRYFVIARAPHWQ